MKTNTHILNNICSKNHVFDLSPENYVKLFVLEILVPSTLKAYEVSLFKSGLVIFQIPTENRKT